MLTVLWVMLRYKNRRQQLQLMDVLWGVLYWCLRPVLLNQSSVDHFQPNPVHTMSNWSQWLLPDVDRTPPRCCSTLAVWRALIGRYSSWHEASTVSPADMFVYVNDDFPFPDLWVCVATKYTWWNVNWKIYTQTHGCHSALPQKLWRAHSSAALPQLPATPCHLFCRPQTG